jgi:hypothetical protein
MMEDDLAKSSEGARGKRRHHNGHHVHFIAAEQNKASFDIPNAALDLEIKLDQGPQEANLFFGMIKARNTYSTSFTVVGGDGDTQVKMESFESDVDSATAHAITVTKLTTQERESKNVERFEVVLTVPIMGKFDSHFFLHATDDGRQITVKVAVTAKVLGKTMGTPVLRDNVRCIAVDHEDDTSDDSDYKGYS